MRPELSVLIGNKYWTITEIAEKLNLPKQTIYYRYKQLKKTGEPYKNIFNEKQWVSTKAKIITINGTEYTMKELSQKTGRSISCIRSRLKMIKKMNLSEGKIFDNDFWTTRKLYRLSKKQQSEKIRLKKLQEEQTKRILERYAPSPLEQKGII